MTASLGATAPLLPAQRFKWEAHQRDPDSLDLVITVRLRIRGRLDRAALVASLQALQEAQPALRATFQQGPDGEPVQQVHPDVPLQFDTADVAVEPEPERAAARLAAVEAARPFRLDRPCALRALLVRLAERNHLLVVCASGMVVDGWSIGIIFRRLGAGYRNLTAGQPLVTADHSDEYLECCYATSLAAAPDGPLATDYANWLAGTPRLVLPTDSPYPARRSEDGAEVRVDLTAAEVERTAATARLRHTSPAVVLFAAFTVLLARWSGRRRFAVGAFVSGRTRPEMSDLIGRFAHMAALPVDLTGCDIASDAVDRLSPAWWRGHNYHQVPLASIAEKTGIDTPPGRLLVCDVAFVHLFGEEPVSFGDDLSIHRERVPTPISPHDLTLFVEPAGTDGLGVRLEYRTDLFRETTARTALTRFRATLAELTEEIPDQRGTADD